MGLEDDDRVAGAILPSVTDESRTVTGRAVWIALAV